jgi:hypothetical protein
MSQGLSEGFHFFLLKAFGFVFFGCRLRPRGIGQWPKLILLSVRQLGV